MPHDPRLQLGNQGSEHNPFVAQTIHQVSFVRLTESGFVDKTDLAVVFRAFATDDHVAGCAHEPHFSTP